MWESPMGMGLRQICLDSGDQQESWHHPLIKATLVMRFQGTSQATQLTVLFMNQSSNSHFPPVCYLFCCYKSNSGRNFQLLCEVLSLSSIISPVCFLMLCSPIFQKTLILPFHSLHLLFTSICSTSESPLSDPQEGKSSLISPLSTEFSHNPWSQNSLTLSVFLGFSNLMFHFSSGCQEGEENAAAERKINIPQEAKAQAVCSCVWCQVV